MNPRYIQELFNIIKNPELETDERNRLAAECRLAIVTKKNIWSKYDNTFDVTDEDGATLLLLATSKHQIDILKMLLKMYANPDKPHAKTGITPLAYAAEIGHIDTVKYLLIAKANPHLPNIITKESPLDLAVKNGHLQIVQQLVEAGASPRMPNANTGVTPLASAAQEGRTDIVQWLLESGEVHPDDANCLTGERPLSLAAKHGHVDIVRLLLKMCVDQNEPNVRTGEIPLHLAAENGHVDCVKELLKAHHIFNSRPNVDFSNRKTGDTALICAARKGHREVVQVLIDAKASLEKLNNKLNTALEEAVENEKLPIVALLLSHGTKIRFSDNLFNFVIRCDQRDPDVLFSFTELCKQLTTQLNNRDCYDPLLTGLKKTAVYHLKQLKKLAAIHQKKLFDAVDRATITTLIPDVVGIISEYDAPLESPRLNFFKAAELDALLPREVPDPQEIEKPGCSVL